MDTRIVGVMIKTNCLIGILLLSPVGGSCWSSCTIYLQAEDYAAVLYERRDG